MLNLQELTTKSELPRNMSVESNPMTSGLKEGSNSDLLKSWVEEHSDYLYRYARRYFRNLEIVEDLVQETFLAAVQAIEKFERKSTPKTWLTGILRHKILDRLRKNQKDLQFSSENEINGDFEKLFDANEHWTIKDGPTTWMINPEAVLEQKQFMSALKTCLAKLPEKIRHIFLLREVEGFSRDEICTQVNLTSTNVGVILHRARLSLQNCLQNNWLKFTMKGQ